MHRQGPVILEGIPVYPPERRRMDLATLPAPPPMEVLEIEPLVPLTQPPPREEAKPHRNEATPSDELD
jgi:hypothetical protein